MRLADIRGGAIAAALLLALPASSLGGETPGAPTFDPAVARRIGVEELSKRLDAGERVVIIDSRAGVDGTMIKGAVHVPNDRLEAWAKGVAKDTLIVTYCA
jgi:hypothetical protein